MTLLAFLVSSFPDGGRGIIPISAYTVAEEQ